MTPSSRSGVGSPAAIAARTRATASAWGGGQVGARGPRAAEPGRPGGERPARPLADLDLDEAPPDEAGRGRRASPWRSPTASGRGDASAGSAARPPQRRSCLSQRRRRWRGPSGRPVALPGASAARGRPVRGQPDPALVARPGGRGEQRPVERRPGPRSASAGAGGADPPGPPDAARSRTGRGPSRELVEQVAVVGVQAVRRAASGRSARRRSSSRSRKPGGSIARRTIAGGAR